MAQMLTNDRLDFRQFNLFEMVDQFDNFAFYNNANPSVDSQELPGLVGSFSAEDLGAFWTGANNPDDAGDRGARLYFAGNALVINSNNNAVSGTVTGMSLKESYGGPAKTFDFYGFRIGAVAFQNAAMTQGNADDISLLKTALSGADRITGAGFADFAYGWTGNDIMVGNGGNDSLSGDAGNDKLYGGSGLDVLKGGTGTDTLTGGAGADQLYGGADSVLDVFVFSSRTDSPNSSGRDVIRDFHRGQDDISLAAMDANANAGGNQTFGWGAKTAGAYKVWYATANGNATVYADVTGDRVADFSVQLIGVTSLASGDFVL